MLTKVLEKSLKSTSITTTGIALICFFFAVVFESILDILKNLKYQYFFKSSEKDLQHLEKLNSDK